MVGPNKQFDKDDVLQKAMLVFWEKGYEATSMQDLVTSMGINRASMYQTYGNKYQLFLASISRYKSNTFDFVSEYLQQGGSPLDNLQQLFQMMIEHSLNSDQHGCLINNTAIELAPHDDDIADSLRDFFEKIEVVFEQQLQRAYDQHEIAPSHEVQSLALLLNTNLQGLMVQSKTKLSKQKLFDNIDTLFNFIRL